MTVRRRARLGLVAAALAVVLLACGGDDGPADEPDGACVDYSGVDFSGEHVTQSFACSNIGDADFTGATIEGASFNGSSLEDAVLDDVTWIDTVCPDGTNSDDHGDSCVGHLSP